MQPFPGSNNSLFSPRVARSSQPWAESCNPVGIDRTSDNTPGITCNSTKKSEERRGTNIIRSNQGFTLLECIAYVSLLAVVIGFATKIFFQAWDDNKALRRDADDIARALHTGDQWRADLRAANGPVQVTNTGDAEQISIPVPGGEIGYKFSEGKLWRGTTDDGMDQVWLSNVKSSKMQSELRENVTAWRWELELKTVKKTARVRPLFTFEAVAGSTSRP